MTALSIESVESFGCDDDIRLVDRFLGGDQTAFEQIYSLYYSKVFTIAKGVVIDAEEAADAVQEIFTLVYRNLHKFDRRSRLSTWIYRIAVNRSIQQGRASRFKYRFVDIDHAREIPDNSHEQESDPAVAQAMSELSPSDRAIILLFYWDDLSLNEIAESFGCNENAAKTRLFRARERFRKLYEEASS